MEAQKARADTGDMWIGEYYAIPNSRPNGRIDFPYRGPAMALYLKSDRAN